MKSKTMLLALAAALTATASIAVPAHAAPTRKVSYADLDLSSPDGQAELQRRISRAARQVCLYQADGAVIPTEAQKKCFRQARTQATQRLATLIADSQRGG